MIFSGLSFAINADVAIPQPSNSNFGTSALSNDNQEKPSDKLKQAASKHNLWEKDLPAWVNNLIALGSAIVSLVNLIVVILFFRRANHDRLNEREEDRSERTARIQQEVGNFWIKELVLKTNHDFVQGFFDKYENKIKEFRMECSTTGGRIEDVKKHSATMVEEFKNDFHELDRKILEPLSWVSHEFKILRSTVEDLEDFITNQFGTIKIPSEHSLNESQTAEIKYGRLRNEFYRRLHEAHRKAVGI